MINLNKLNQLGKFHRSPDLKPLLQLLLLLPFLLQVLHHVQTATAFLFQ